MKRGKHVMPAKAGIQKKERNLEGKKEKCISLERSESGTLMCCMVQKLESPVPAIVYR